MSQSTDLISKDNPEYQKLFNDISSMIRQGQQRVATEVNSTTVVLYWSIGKRIDLEVLSAKRADYGDKIIESISKELTIEFGEGYSRSGLFRMLRFSGSIQVKKLSQHCRDNYPGRKWLFCVK